MLLEQCNVAYQIAPFDEGLYQECIDEVRQRGYPMDSDFRPYLWYGVVYAANTRRHLPHRPTQIWIVLYIACTIYIDDVSDRFPEEMANIYIFNDRFIRKETQENPILDAFADILRRVSDLYLPVASHLITTSTLNFITAMMLEHETKHMKVWSKSRAEDVVDDDE